MEDPQSPATTIEPEHKKSQISSLKGKKVVPPAALLLMLGCVVFVSNGGYSMLDMPQALASPLIHYFDVTTKEIGLLYTAYSLPNFVVGPLAGYLIQVLGAPTATFILASTCFLGMLTIYVGVQIKQFWLLYVGRALFGAGTENVIVSSMAGISEWYFGRYLSLATGVTQSLNLFSGSLGNFMGPWILVETRDLRDSIFFGCCICMLSTVASAGFVYFDFFLREKYVPPSLQDSLEAENKAEERAAAHEHEKESILPKEEQEEKPQLQWWQKIFRFNKLYWWSCLCYGLVPNSYFQLNNNMTDFCQNRFGYTYLEAKSFISEVQLISIFMIPTISWIALRVGYKGYVMLLGIFILLVSYINMLLLPDSPNPRIYISIVLFALYYSLFNATIWPCLSLSIPEDGAGIGWGLATVSQMFFYAVLPYIFGSIAEDRTVAAYQNYLVALIGLTLLSIGVVVGLNVLDLWEGGLLNKPENSEEVKKLKKKLNDYYIGLESGSEKSEENVPFQESLAAKTEDLPEQS